MLQIFDDGGSPATWLWKFAPQRSLNLYEFAIEQMMRWRRYPEQTKDFRSCGQGQVRSLTTATASITLHLSVCRDAVLCNG